MGLFLKAPANGLKSAMASDEKERGACLFGHMCFLVSRASILFDCSSLGFRYSATSQDAHPLATSTPCRHAALSVHVKEDSVTVDNTDDRKDEAMMVKRSGEENAVPVSEADPAEVQKLAKVSRLLTNLPVFCAVRNSVDWARWVF